MLANTSYQGVGESDTMASLDVSTVRQCFLNQISKLFCALSVKNFSLPTIKTWRRICLWRSLLWEYDNVVIGI